MEIADRYDAVVVGAGPAGSTAAALMAREGLAVLVVDSAAFPRQKVCGDAISGKSVDVLRELGLLEDIAAAESIDSWGILFAGAYGDEVEIPFSRDYERPVPPGYLCRRDHYDDLLLENARRQGASVLTETSFEKLLRDDGRIRGVRIAAAGRTHEVDSPILVGADGAYSRVARQMGMPQLDQKHYYASVRTYYEGVTGFRSRNYIELHFMPEVAPGYFWIFPMPGGHANVGIVMLSSAVKAGGARLKTLLDEMVHHPRFRDRFSTSRRVAPVKGWGLPLGSKPRNMAGDGWLLAGDAASLIDPFTGEGIGNAMVSGSEAARWILRAHDAGDFSVEFLNQYEQAVLDILGRELRLSHALQRLCRWKWPLNFVIRKAGRSQEMADVISSMFDDLGERKKLVSPAFYLRLLFS